MSDIKQRMGSYEIEMVKLLPRCDKNDHFIGSNSLVVYCTANLCQASAQLSAQPTHAHAIATHAIRK